MTTLKAPELLLPAGSLDKMRAAYDFGADAVYAGQPRYSLRARNNEFRLEQIQQGIARGARARQEVLCDQQPDCRTTTRCAPTCATSSPSSPLQPDALIMADPGLIMMVRENWPEVPIHLSVQANTTNYGRGEVLAEAGRGAHHPVARTEPGRDRENPPGMPRHGAGSVRARRAVHCLLGPLPARRATSTAATPTRAPAPTPAAGTTPRTTPPSTRNTGEAIAQHDGRRLQLRQARREGRAGLCSTCGSGAAPPAWPTRSTCWKKRAAPASSCPSWKTSTAPTS